MGALAVQQAEARIQQAEAQIRYCAKCGCIIACACDRAPDKLDGLWLSDYSVDEVDTDTPLNELSIVDQYYY